MPGASQMRRRNQGASRPFRRANGSSESDYAYQSSSGRAADNEGGGSSCCQTFLKVMAVIIIAPPLLNYATLVRERQLLQPENHTLYDIGFGQKMHMSCLGHGPLTVIIDGPAGQTSDICLPLQEELSALARVCIFDRAGMGFSDPMPFFNRSDPVENAMAGPTEYTTRRTAQDLHRLITRALPHARDLVLIGSQLGSLNMVQYAHSFPEGVAQLILLDPPHPSLYGDEGWNTYVNEYWSPYTRMVQMLALFGLNRLGILLGAIKFPPPCAGAAAKRTSGHDGSGVNGDHGTHDEVLATVQEACIRSQHFMTDPGHIGAGANEIERMEASAAQLSEQLSQAATFKIPASVITGNYYDETLPMNLNRAWAKAARETISELSAQQVIVNDADSKMLYTKPDDLLYAIRKIIKRVKRNQKAATE